MMRRHVFVPTSSFETGVTSTELVATVATLALAAFVHGVFGIGFAMIATPLLALLLDHRSAVFLAAVPLLAMATCWLIAHRRSLCDTSIPKGLLGGICVGALCGVALQATLSPRASLLLLAALITTSLVVPIILARWRPGNEPLAWQAAPALGTLAGVTESALNVGAPFMVLYGGLAKLERLQQLLALNLCFCIGKAIQVGLTASSAPPLATGPALAWGTAACVLAYAAGDRWAGKFPERTFLFLLRGFLVLMVLALVARASMATLPHPAS